MTRTWANVMLAGVCGALGIVALTAGDYRIAVGLAIGLILFTVLAIFDEEDNVSDYRAIVASDCPRWGALGHNWIIIKGILPWRRYRVCCACQAQERV